MVRGHASTSNSGQCRREKVREEDPEKITRSPYGQRDVDIPQWRSFLGISKGCGTLPKTSPSKRYYGGTRLIALCYKRPKRNLLARSVSNQCGVVGIVTPANGSAGAMLIAWKKELFDLISIEHGFYSLSVKLFDRISGLTGWYSCIYGPSYNRGKQEFWTELFDLGNLSDGIWCVGGDFNKVLYS